jgi:hypothetical protein
MPPVCFQDSRDQQNFQDMSSTIQFSFINLVCLAPAWIPEGETSDFAGEEPDPQTTQERNNKYANPSAQTQKPIGFPASGYKITRWLQDSFSFRFDLVIPLTRHSPTFARSESNLSLSLPYLYSIEGVIDARQKLRRRSNASTASTSQVSPLTELLSERHLFFLMKTQSTIETAPAAFHLNFSRDLQKFA